MTSQTGRGTRSGPEGPTGAPHELTGKGNATRARLLAAASNELAERGTLELATVADRAGVVQSALYRYFAGKDGLVEAVVHDFYDQYGAEVFDAPIETGGDWLEREAVRLRREVHFLYTHPLGRAVAAGLVHEAAATKADAERLRAQSGAAARNIRHGQRAGELHPDIDAGLVGAALMGALRAMLAEALSRDPSPPEQHVADAVIAMGAALLERASHPDDRA
ncbi:TetR/AcrR family transcriptional regulator [Pseudonocardia spinosispora]|uniref:TetR/AcrR family transcriptional regulator n=1 Tax=Pseudonocardia spinosispora TaxID=103441 RepID=UPI00041056DC|nr:TetR/AcrR family transcriptional regulator [Pseudonocardia spinosispora]